MTIATVGSNFQWHFSIASAALVPDSLAGIEQNGCAGVAFVLGNRYQGPSADMLVRSNFGACSHVVSGQSEEHWQKLRLLT